MYWVGRKIDGGSYHVQALDLIKRQIYIGTLRPEERFPPERKLSETLGISRVTLREALKNLETHGFIVAVRGAKGGTFVGNDEAINTIAQQRVFTQPDQVWRSLEFLRANIVLASLLACERRTPSDLEALRASVQKMGKASSGGELREAQYLFCAGLCDASMNPYLKEATETALEGIFHPIFEDSLRDLAIAKAGKCLSIVDAVDEQDNEASALRTSEFVDGIAAYIKALMMGGSASSVFQRSLVLGSSMKPPGSVIGALPSLLSDPSNSPSRGDRGTARAR